MQTHYCVHCGQEFPDTLRLFLHLYTEKFHVDIGLRPEQSKALVEECEPQGREVVVWEN